MVMVMRLRRFSSDEEFTNATQDGENQGDFADYERFAAHHGHKLKNYRYQDGRYKQVNAGDHRKNPAEIMSSST